MRAARFFSAVSQRVSKRPIWLGDAATPEAAVDRLEALYEQAKTALRGDLHHFFATGEPPDAAQRSLYRYPLLRVTYAPSQLPAATRRGT